MILRIKPPPRSPLSDPWVKALKAIDRLPRGGQDIDLKGHQLIELLRSDTPLDRDSRWYLADMLERYRLKRRRGKQQKPNFEFSSLDWAKETARNYVNQGMNPEEAWAGAARAVGLPDSETLLENYRKGKNTSQRKQRKRRPPTRR
jgi:hypothetical protein